MMTIFLKFAATPFADEIDGSADAHIVAGNITDIADGISGIVYIICYVVAFAFFLSAIAKYKKHRENPFQIHLGVVMLDIFIALCLLGLPTIAQYSTQAVFKGEPRAVDSRRSNLPNYATPNEPPNADILVKPQQPIADPAVVED